MTCAEPGGGNKSKSGRPGRRRFHAIVHGHVQGVSFRYYARQRAAALGVRGWVRNCDDSSVEVVAEGDEDALRRFLSWLHGGPTLARVTQVDVTWGDACGLGAGDLLFFEVRH